MLQIWQCMICDIEGRDSSVAHIKTHVSHVEEYYECQGCERKYQDEEALSQHIHQVHILIAFRCSVCVYTIMETAEEIRAHLITHIGGQ